MLEHGDVAWLRSVAAVAEGSMRVAGGMFFGMAKGLEMRPSARNNATQRWWQIWGAEKARKARGKIEHSGLQLLVVGIDVMDS